MMSDTEAMITLSQLTVTEYRKFRKALRVLVSGGMYYEDATRLLAESIDKRKQGRYHQPKIVTPRL